MSIASIIFSAFAGVLVGVIGARLAIAGARLLWPHVLKVDFAQLFDSFVERSRQALVPCACLGAVIAGVGIFMWGMSNLHGPGARYIDPPPDASAADLAAIKFQHQNYDDGAGNFIFVYCDTMTGDRIYVLGNGAGKQTSMSVVPGGCK